MLIGGATLEAHDRAVLRLTAQLKEYGFHDSTSKMQRHKSEVEYLVFNVKRVWKVTM